MSGNWLLSALVALAIPTCAQAAEPAEASEFKEIVVTASAEGAEAKRLPAFVQVITQKELRSAGVQNLEQALMHYVPGSGNSAPGAYTSVGMRGVRSGANVNNVLGDRVTLLIDGMRASSGNPSVIPFAIIDRIEIVRGPSSVLYGGSAMGGVVNVITKRGRDDIHGEVGASYGRFDNARGHAAVAGSLSEKMGMALGLSSGKIGNYKTGNGIKYDNTHAANTDIGGTFTYTNENTSLHLVGIHRSLYDMGSPGSVTWATPDDRLNMHYTRFSGQLEHKTDAGHSFSAAVYGDDNRYKIAGPDYYSGSYDSKYKNVTLGTRLLGGLSLGDFGRLSLGIDYANMRDEAYGSSVGQPDMRTDVTGLFAEYRYEGEAFSSFSGLRYDNYSGEMKSNKYESKAHGSKDYDHVSWRAGAVYWLTDWLGVKGNIGTAFVAPTAVNLAGDYSGSWGRYVGNPDLKAEKSLTAEGGFEVEYGGAKAEVIYFQSWYKDRISYAYHSTIPYAMTWMNVASQRLDGFDISLSWRGSFDELKVTPYVHSEIFTKKKNGDGSAVAYVPHHSTVAGISLGYGRVWLDMNARFTGTQKEGNTDRDDYAVVNAKLTFNVTDSLDVYCGVNNITDRMYEVATGYPMPGRAVYGGFNYKF